MWSSSDYVYKGSPRKCKVPQAYIDWSVNMAWKQPLWRLLALWTPVMQARNDGDGGDDDDDDDESDVGDSVLCFPVVQGGT